MSGLPDNNRPAFNRVAQVIRQAGFQVFNPAELDQTAQWQELMKVCLAELVRKDAIVLLEGWENSRGAKIEKYVADNLLIPSMAWEQFKRHLQKIHPDWEI